MGDMHLLAYSSGTRPRMGPYTHTGSHTGAVLHGREGCEDLNSFHFSGLLLCQAGGQPKARHWQRLSSWAHPGVKRLLPTLCQASKPLQKPQQGLPALLLTTTRSCRFASEVSVFSSGEWGQLSLRSSVTLQRQGEPRERKQKGETNPAGFFPLSLPDQAVIAKSDPIHP